MLTRNTGNAEELVIHCANEQHVPPILRPQGQDMDVDRFI